MPFRRSGTALFLLLLSAFFICAGTVLIRYPGLQNDEVFFAPPIFTVDDAFYAAQIGRARIPVMVMSYTGALKTWLYALIFTFWDPSRWTVRIPVLLACLAVIWLTWFWTRTLAADSRPLDKSDASRAAIAAATLLATDSMFLLTGLFDWGPVALQHLLLMSGIVCIASYLRSASRRMLAAGFFLWGLGLWDKALLIWPLLGLAIAAVCVYPRELRTHLKPATIAIAFAALLAGAAPLVWYNVARHGETATANAKFSRHNYGEKMTALVDTFNGSALVGYMVDAHPMAPQRPPRGVVERVSFAVRRMAGTRKSNLFLWIFAASVLAMVWLRRSPYFRPMLFLLIAMAVAWVQMFITHGTGGSAHHVVLLWPLPFVFTGLALAAMADAVPRYGSAAFIAVLSILAIANLLNENEYLARFAIRGGIGGWTDAIYPLSDSLDDSRWIGVVDWGYLNGLRVLHDGRIKLFTPGDQAFKPQLTPSDWAELKKAISNPDFVYVEHTAGKEIFTHANEKLRSRAAELGYSEHVLKLVADSSGAPVFEIFRFEPAQQRAGLR